MALTIAITVGFAAWMATNSNQAPDASGESHIGGTFALVDTQGKPYDTARLKGGYSLIFFGFTHCPEICPTALSSITQALQVMDKDKAARIIPVFITVDPVRDTPEVMAEYAAHFHPSLVALTGSQEQIKKVIDGYKVYASKHENTDMPDGYTMDHSGYIYLMDPQGDYVTHFAHTITPQELAEKLSAVIARN